MPKGGKKRSHESDADAGFDPTAVKKSKSEDENADADEELPATHSWEYDFVKARQARTDPEPGTVVDTKATKGIAPSDGDVTMTTAPSYTTVDEGEIDQVGYGPAEGLTGDDLDLVRAHMYPDAAYDDRYEVATRRHETKESQYSASHHDYVLEARAAGRALTKHEGRVAERMDKSGLQPAEFAPEQFNLAGKAKPRKNKSDNKPKKGQRKAKTKQDEWLASINHVIAAGVGQNTLNTGIVHSALGRELVEQNLENATSAHVPTDDVGREQLADSQGAVRAGIAHQAASVGRQQMYTRAIVEERARIPTRDTAEGSEGLLTGWEEADDDVLAESKRQERGRLLKQTVRVMGPDSAYAPAPAKTPSTTPTPKSARWVKVGEAYQKAPETEPGDDDTAASSDQPVGPLPKPGPAVLPTPTPEIRGATLPEKRMSDYSALLKETFNSPANLRVGHAGTNGRVSTGLDEELDQQDHPTARSGRLAEAHDAAKPDHDDRVHTTIRSTGERLSSSHEVKPDATQQTYIDAASERARAKQQAQDVATRARLAEQLAIDAEEEKKKKETDTSEQ